METIAEYWPKARKRHFCNYCHDEIKTGEKYHKLFLKDGGDCYTWIECSHCELIISEIFSWVDPDGGMDDQDFYEACKDFTCKFICHNEDRKLYDCDCDCDFIERTYNCVKENELIFDRSDMLWKLKKRRND